MATSITLVFVHGWSVTNKNTYGKMPEAIQELAATSGISIQTRHIFLARYISFHDEVTVDDIVRAMDFAVRNDLSGVKEFSCITHSTGGPLVRRWVDMFYGAKNLARCPLRHLIMLAPANHGSALAIIGKSRIGRIKAWFEGVEPGQGVLDWLCLGSEQAWQLQERFTAYTLKGTGFYPFVLSGETIDTSFYDFLNQYLVEWGSDGVVRLAGANLNYTFIRLEQTEERHDGGSGYYALRLVPRQASRPPRIPFGVIPDASHSGTKIGIMRSVKPSNVDQKPVATEIIKCLQVTSGEQYASRTDELERLTTATQIANAAQYKDTIRRFVMFIFRIRDDTGGVISDYDLLLLGDDFQPDKLPKGFYVDHQKNPKSHALTYYMNYDILTNATHLGVRVTARPSFAIPGERAAGFAGYVPGEFRLSGKQLRELIQPNETVYVDIVLSRKVDREAMRFDPVGDGRGSFKQSTPRGGI